MTFDVWQRLFPWKIDKVPGLQGKQFDVDTTQWTVDDWCRVRSWNIVFLIGWIEFFGLAVGNLLYKANWLVIVSSLVIAVFGGSLQLVRIVRLSNWLTGQRNP